MGQRSWTVAPNGGKVLRVDSSASRQSLLVLTDGLRAQIWDLKNRTCRRLRGSWNSGVLLDDDNLVLTATADASDHRGKLVGVHYDRDRARFELKPDRLRTFHQQLEDPRTLAFEGLCLSPDGTRLAATANPSQPALVCVWDAKTGQLTHWTTHLDDPVRSLSFSTDGKHLLTAGDSPAAKLWNLAAGRGELITPEATFEDPNAGGAFVTCAAIRPAHDQVVTGHSDGQVNLWSWKDGKARLEAAQLVQGVFAGQVKAFAFTADGRKLAAAGDGTTIWLGSLENQPGDPGSFDGPHHFEQINSLLTWSDPPMLISGSDDTTVRFWDLKRRALWGTFSAAASAPDEAPNDPVQDLDWVFHTPDGFFDGSAGGQKLVRFRLHEVADPMERFEDTHYRFRLE